MGFFKKKSAPATAVVIAEPDPPKKEALSKRLFSRRAQLTSDESKARFAARNQLADHHALSSHVTGHAGTQMAMWGARTGGAVSRSLGKDPATAASTAAVLAPLGSTLATLGMLTAVFPLITAYSDILELANDIHRKIVNFVVLADTTSDLFKSRVTLDAITQRQKTEITVILEKMEATAGQATEVLEKIQGMGVIKITTQVAQLKNDFTPIRVKVTNLLRSLHARITAVQLALFDAQADQAQIQRDALAATSDTVRSWMSQGERDILAAIRQSNEGHTQVAVALRALLKEIETLGVPPGVYARVKNKEVLALWQTCFGNSGPIADGHEFVEAMWDYGIDLYAKGNGHIHDQADMETVELLFAWTAPFGHGHAQTCVVEPKELGLFDVLTDPKGKHVSLLVLDKECDQLDEDVLQPVNVPTLLFWRVYAWTGFSQSLVDSLTHLSQSLPLVSSPLLGPITSRFSGMLASLRDLWHANPAVRHRIDQLTPILSFSRTGERLLPCTQSLVDALTTLVALMAPMASVAREGMWLMDPDGDDAKMYTTEFPEHVARAWNKVVEAARGMGLEDATDMGFAENHVADIKQALAHALTQQKDAVEQVTDLVSPQILSANGYLDTAFGAYVAEWSLLNDYSPTQRIQPLVQLGGHGMLLQLTNDEATRILPSLARLLPVLATAPHVTRVTAIFPPVVGVYTYWGVAIATDSPASSLHEILAQLSRQPGSLPTRIQLARHVALGTFAVLAACTRWTAVDPDCTRAPLGLSPYSIAVAQDAMGTWTASVPLGAGLVPLPVATWDAAYVAPGTANGLLGPDAAAAVDVFALGKVLACVLPGLEADKGGKTLDALVARMCHGDAAERSKVTLEYVLGALDRVVIQADLDAISVEELPIVLVAPAASPSPSQPSQPKQQQPVAPELPPYPTLSPEEAQANFHTARNRIRNCIGRPISDPDYDVDDTVTLLLSAGMPGHVPMALVLAADMWYYGAIQPRQQPDCWLKAKYLYGRAADLGCKYANVGLGDLAYFGLAGAPDPAAAHRYYQLALEHVDHPTANLDLTETMQARVFCGMGDALTWQADAGGAPALYVQALGYFQRAFALDPKSKRALARKAMFKVRQLGGETWDRTLVLAWKQAARSRDNPVPELKVRLSLYEMDGDGRGAEAVKRMIAMAEVPEH